MALFPPSPSNNDTTTVNGIEYTYNSSITAWVRTTTSLGNISANSAIFVGSVSAASLTASGNVSGNYFIGNGALLTGLPGGTAITNGTSNVSIPASSGNVNTSVGGTPNVLVVTNIGANVSGYANITGNANVGNLGTSGNITAGYYFGNGSQLTGISAATASSIANGTSNVSIPASGGNVNTSVAGNANILVVTGTGINVAGTLNSTGNANVGNIGATNANVTAITATGNANVGNLGTTGLITATGNITGGNLTTGGILSVTGNANVGNIGATNANVTAITATGNANVGNIGATNANVTAITATGNANVGNLGTAGLIIATGNITGGNITTSGLASVGNLIFSNPGIGNTTSITFTKTNDATGFQVAEYSSDKTLYNFYLNDNAYGANGDGFMWTLGSWTGTNHLAQPIYLDGGAYNRFVAISTYVYGNIIQTTSKTFSTSNLGGTGLSSSLMVFGDVTKLGYLVTGTITITALNVSGYTGGSGAQFWIKLTGTGNTFDWGYGSPTISPTPIETGLSVSTSPVSLSNGVTVTFSSTTGGVAGDLYGCVLWTSVTNTFGPTTISGNANVGNLGTTGLITATGNITGGNLTTGGILSVTGNANVGNLGTAGLITATGNITGGNLLGRYANGTSNIFINTANGNIALSVGGTSNVVIVTTTGINVAGTLNATGNANVGNIGATNANITAITATGNANVGNLGTAGLITATGNITGGNLTTGGILTVTGNATAGNFIGTLANGTSNVAIPSANGNINLTVGGGTPEFVVTSTGANVVGTLDVTGNTTVGNLIGTVANGTSNISIVNNANINMVRSGTTRLVVTNSGVTVTGSFTATSKSFFIEHPTKLGYHLQYGSLESPYHGVRLTGEGTTKNGKCTIQLPDYIRALVKEEGAQVQLTNYKHGKTLYIDNIDVTNNMFVVKSNWKLGELKFFWSFTAIRKDIDDLEVEINGVDK